MPNELGKVSSWIPHELLAVPAITNIVGADGVWPGVAPEDAGDTFIVYAFVTGSGSVQTLNHRRTLFRCKYDIRATVRGPANANLRTLADEIDTLFSNFSNRQWSGWNFSSWWDDALRMDELIESTKERWTHLGATYRISAYKL